MAHRWSRICCPVDFSETSSEALAQAAELAACDNAQLIVLHVLDRATSGVSGEVLIAAPELEERVIEEANRQLERCQRQAEQLAPGRVATEAVSGEAASEIVRFLERGAFDLAVMGTHGRTGIRRLVLGSVAERVVRHAPCSVLVVRPAQLRFAEPD